MTKDEVLDAIAAGSLDGDLAAFRSAIDTRLATIRALKKPTDFGLGDKVVFNNHCGTRYLVGHTATIVGRKKVKLVVRLDAPTGRFARVSPSGEVISADITVPISIVDPA